MAAKFPTFPANAGPKRPARPGVTRTPAKAKQKRKPGNGFTAPRTPGKPAGKPTGGATGKPKPGGGKAPLADTDFEQESLLENPPPGAESTPNAPKGAFTQLGSYGLYRSGGLVYDEIIRELNGTQGFKHYREIAENSAVAGACLLAIEMLIRKVPWRVQPGDQSEIEKYRADVIESMFHDMSQSWADTVSEILTMLIFGFSWLEIVYKIRRGPEESNGKYRSQYSDGIIGWRKWVPIPQETLYQWEWDEEGGIAAMKQIAPPDYANVRTIPITKSLLFRTKTTKNNPQGKSMLRSAWHPWRWVKRVMEVEGIGIERDLAGLPFAGVPPEILDPNASAEDKAQLEYVKKVVTNVRQNSLAGVVFPLAYDDEQGKPLWEFKLMSTGGMKQFDTGKIIERYERRIAMSMLADFVMMGHERVGSLALSKDKVSIIGRVLAALVDSISSVINRHAIKRIYLLNGWQSIVPARLVPGDVENNDIKNLGIYVRNLMSVGALTPDPALEGFLREAAGMPPQDPAYQLGPGEVAPGITAQEQAQMDSQLATDEALATMPPSDNASGSSKPSNNQGDASSQPDKKRKPQPGDAQSGSSRPNRAKPSFPRIPQKLRPSIKADFVDALAEVTATFDKRLADLSERISGMPAPVVNVEVAPAAAPVVHHHHTTTVEAAEAPIVNVEAAKPATFEVTKDVERDDRGLVSRVTETHTPVAE